MGLTHITAAVINPADPKKRVRMEFLVDSGAIYSVVPQTVLKKLGIKPCGSKEFTLADGTKIMRRFGNALFTFQKTPGASPVIFGEKGDTPLLGMVSLEALGYILDPLRRELLARIPHAYLLRRPMLSPGAAFLARPPQRTAVGTPASSSLARSHGGLRPQPPRCGIHG